MKNFMKSGFVMLLASMFLLTSCGKDPVTVDDTTDPTATIVVGTTYEDQTFAPGTALAPISVKFEKGSAELNAIQVNRNGEKMTTGWNLTNADGDILDPSFDPSKTFVLSGDDKQGVTLHFLIILSDKETIDEYTFHISDTDNNTGATESLSIETKDPGTPVKVLEGKLLKNSSGPTGTGGLDLDEGIGTGSSAVTSEIADNGGTDKWERTFRGINGSKIVPLDDTFDFEGITTKEQLPGLFSESAVVTNTAVVNEGDIFLVKNGDKYFLLKTTSVVETTAVGDNTDHYEFTIKQ